MRIVLDGITAFEYWRCAILADGARALHTTRPELTIFEGKSSKQISERIRAQEGEQGRIHVLVSSDIERRNSEFVSCSIWPSRLSLPFGAILQIGTGIYVESPEFCLLRLATSLSRFEFLRALSDMLGVYGLSYLDRQALVSRKPLTTKAKIAAFLDSVGPVRGSRLVRDALKWVVERSASPRETSMNLCMTMPTRMGGQSMPEFEANHKFTLTREAKLLTRRNYLIGDAVWVDSNTEMEYNSSKHHDTEEQLEMDFEKITALEQMGVTVFPVSTRQFNDYHAFAVIVQSVRTRLGVGANVSPAVEERRFRTHEEILRIERYQRNLPSLVDTARWQYLVPRLDTEILSENVLGSASRK